RPVARQDPVPGPGRTGRRGRLPGPLPTGGRLRLGRLPRPAPTGGRLPTAAAGLPTADPLLPTARSGSTSSPAGLPTPAARTGTASPRSDAVGPPPPRSDSVGTTASPWSDSVGTVGPAAAWRPATPAVGLPARGVRMHGCFSPAMRTVSAAGPCVGSPRPGPPSPGARWGRSRGCGGSPRPTHERTPDRVRPPPVRPPHGPD